MMPVQGIISGSPITGPLVYDTFTDTDTTAIDSHAADIGGTWTQDASYGNIQISSNRAVQVAPAGYAQAYIDVGASDVSVTADISFVNTSSVAIYLIARLSNSTDRIVAWIDRGLNAVKLNAGATALDSQSFTVTESSVYEFSLICSGTSITVKIDGTTYISKTSSYNQTETKAGFAFYDPTLPYPAYIDNLRIESV